jgi:hypothetical protein
MPNQRRVYHALVLLKATGYKGIIAIVGEICQATREPMQVFLGAVAQIEKHRGLRIVFRKP